MRIERVSLQYDITPAKLLYESTPTQMQIKVTRGGLQVDNDPVKMELNNTQLKDSIGIRSIAAQAQDTVQQGRAAALDAAGRYTRQKNAMTGPDAMDVAQVTAAQQRTAPVTTTLAFIPTQQPQINWSGGNTKMEYVRDQMDISWEPYEMEFTYVPYSIDYYLEKR